MAPSTYAMSIYNALAERRGRDATTLALAERMPVAMAQAALNGLVARGWVRLEAGAYDVRDPKRRIVRWRSHADADAVVDGVQVGGWTGWMVQCRQRGQLSIDDAIAEGA